jgi:4-hydroxy-tetrahydrodipicolinate synthase
VKEFSGVFAAVLTPRRADDAVDTDALARLIRFQLSKGISSFALNGATGEFCLTHPEELQIILQTVNEASGGSARMICGIGAPGVVLAQELAKVAQTHGAAGLLLPAPYFFRYQQQDLDAFSRTVAEATQLPVLLYNLPQFSSGFEKESVRSLIEEVPNIIGIKDSGGTLDILRDLTQHGVEACRIVGNDTALRGALSEGVCDGVVSGIACVLPELILKLYAQGSQAGDAKYDESWAWLREVAKQFDAMPTPWALKWIAEARGIFNASFAQPLGYARLKQGAGLKHWIAKAFPAMVPAGTLAA